MIRRNTLVSSTLTTMARQRLGLDEGRCVALLELLDCGAELDTAMHGQLAKEGLSDVKFSILLSLFALEPNPTCPADLAEYAGYTRSSVTDAVQDLQAHGLVRAERATGDRRSVEVRLTDSGRQTTERAIARYLQNLKTVLQTLTAEPPAILRQIGVHLAQSAQLISP